MSDVIETSSANGMLVTADEGGNSKAEVVLICANEAFLVLSEETASFHHSQLFVIL